MYSCAWKIHKSEISFLFSHFYNLLVKSEIFIRLLNQKIWYISGTFWVTAVTQLAIIKQFKNNFFCCLKWTIVLKKFLWKANYKICFKIEDVGAFAFVQFETAQIVWLLWLVTKEQNNPTKQFEQSKNK